MLPGHLSVILLHTHKAWESGADARRKLPGFPQPYPNTARTDPKLPTTQMRRYRKPLVVEISSRPLVGVHGLGLGLDLFLGPFVDVLEGFDLGAKIV